MKTSVRIASLTLGGSGPKSLGSMSAHGMRLDGTSRRRRVRDVDPLVHGGLDLRALYDAHVAGCRMNRGLKRPVMHALVQFPPELPITPENEQKMLRHAVAFIDQTHGGKAVFAARLDRDEAGRHSVDVFYAPKYEKRTKARGVETWVSTTKHGKELCGRHRTEIERRHGGSFSTGPRQVGIAMQAELHRYLTDVGLRLEARTEKPNSAPDRLEPEAFGAYRDALAAARRLREQGEAYKARTKAQALKMLQDARERSDALLRPLETLGGRVWALRNHMSRKAAQEREEAIATAVATLEAENASLRLRRDQERDRARKEEARARHSADAVRHATLQRDEAYAALAAAEAGSSPVVRRAARPT